MQTPFFSIVIPTFNREAHIAAAVQSALNQSYENFEVIVVDDGSTDNTGDVVRRIADKRLCYHAKQNEERAVARNTGAGLSRGAYVTFLDSDDVLYENHLATAKSFIEEHGSREIFHLGFEIVDSRTGATKLPKALGENVNRQLIDGNGLSCNGVFLRRDIAVENPFNPDRSLSGTEDYELWLRLASRYTIHCDARVTSAILDHEGRSVVTTDRRRLEARIETLERSVKADSAFMDFYGDRLDRFMANNRLYIALHLALSKQDRVGAVAYLFRSLRYWPGVVSNRAFGGTLKRLIV